MEENNGTCNNTTYGYDDYTLYDEHIAGIYIWKIISPIMIIMGTIGSILTITVLNQKSFRKSVCTVYLSALGVSDLMALNTGLLRNWIIWTFQIDIRESSDITCKAHIFLVYLSLDFAAWMLAVVTIERACLVCFPAKVKGFFTKRRALYIILLVAIILIVLNGHMLFGFGDIVQHIDNGTILVTSCTYLSHDYKYFFSHIWPCIDFVIFCGVPSFILILGNAIIIWKAVKSKRNLARVSSIRISQQNQRNNAKISSMTASLLTLNVVFLFATTPISVYMLCFNDWSLTPSTHDLAVLSLMWPVVNILMYGNSALNFGLYILSGKRFRSEAAKLFSSQMKHGVDTAELHDRRNVSAINISTIQVQSINGQ